MTPMQKRLAGTWLSDKKKTLDHWMDYQKLPAGKRRKVAAIFGKLSLRFTPKQVFYEMDGQQWKKRYEVVTEDWHSIVIRILPNGHKKLLDADTLKEFPNLAEPELLHIYFEDGKIERYRVPMGPGATAFEWFRKVG